MGLTVIYAGIWALLEKTGYHPLYWHSEPAPRVKATFGNENYFAGFLIVVLPVLLTQAVPWTLKATEKDKEEKAKKKEDKGEE